MPERPSRNTEPDPGSEQGQSLQQFYADHPEATQKWVDTDADFIDWGNTQEDDQSGEDGEDSGNDEGSPDQSSAEDARSDGQVQVDLTQQELADAAADFYQSIQSDYADLLEQHRGDLESGQAGAQQLEQPPPTEQLERQAESAEEQPLPAANAEDDLYRRYRQQLEGK